MTTKEIRLCKDIAASRTTDKRWPGCCQDLRREYHSNSAPPNFAEDCAADAGIGRR
jgi:hypothetical protein